MQFQFLSILLTVSATVLAQDQNYFPGLLAQFQARNLTSLANAAQQVVSTKEGYSLFLSLQTGGNKTLLAPINAAFEGASPVTANTSALPALLSYHVLSGSFVNGSAFARWPNVTLARTFMNDTNAVNLEGNKSQVVVLTYDDNTIKILNQKTKDKVYRSWTYQNLVVHEIEAVLNIPSSISTLLDSGIIHEYTTLFAGAAKQAGIVPTIEQTKGITVFIPNDAAFVTALAALNGKTPDANTLKAVLLNHVINGTTVYSSDIQGSSSYTSAAGQKFSFKSDVNGTFVTLGNSTAKVVQHDVPIRNGVVHVIDAVLFNATVDVGAASSAYQSATSAAGTNPSAETGPVGAAPAPTGTGTTTGKSGTIRMRMNLSILLATFSVTIAGIFVLFV